jgi:16S rRNA (uracil1498-N3)-methyltransferase
MQLFYTPDISGKTYILSEPESKHCIRVLRLGKNGTVYLTDGQGGLYKAQIIDENPKSCTLEIIEESLQFEQRPYYMHVAMAPTKNMDRLEWFIEKAVEIGIDEFTPIISERSERRIVNINRLEKIAVSAMKQSIKAYKPKINPCIRFDDVLKSSKQKNKMIAFCNSYDPENTENSKSDGETHHKRMPVDVVYKKSESVICLIGPEGDFTQAEIRRAIDSGFTGITLGNSRLRVETAGIYVCATIYHLNSNYALE